jgi:long-chain fatty acid transport protein
MNYKSKIKHEFFNVDHTFELSSPSEMGIGLHWNLANTKSSIGVDCKRVFSSEIYSRSDEPSRSAWFKDMNVLAVGYSYDTDRWSFRLGYRYVGEMYGYDLLELRNPYMSKSHYTIGGTYAFNKNFSTDIAVVYAPFEDTLSDGSTMTANTTSAALGFNYSF